MLGKYVHWLHTRWPAGVVEKLPRVREDYSTNVPGLYVTGDLTGIPLLKFAADSGARVVRTIVADPAFVSQRQEASSEILDLVIVGGGVSGMSAALEAEKLGLRYVILEATEPFSTIVNFPKGKPIFTYPTEMRPSGDLQLESTVKEDLIVELRAPAVEAGIEPRQARVEQINRRGRVLEVVIPDDDSLLARRVIVAIGRSGNFRKLGVPGEDKPKVYNRLHDPQDFCGKEVLVVGGGDSALETAIALAQCGCRVTVSYRKKEFSRPKLENIERIEALMADPLADVSVETPTSERVTTSTGGFMERKAGSIELLLGSRLDEVGDQDVVLTDADGQSRTISNDVVFSMIGREPPLDFFRRSGVRITGETAGLEWVAILIFFFAVWGIYDWKNDGFVSQNIAALSASDVFPNDAPAVIASWGEGWRAQVEDRRTVIGTLAVSMKSRSFYYTFAYTALIGIFGLMRIRRRKTPYVTLQTSALFFIQLFPLFLLPELILPWWGYHGGFESGVMGTVADELMPLYGGLTDDPTLAPDWGHPRAYWRAYGLILAWPLMVYNIFTSEPLVGWLIVSFVQTFVIIPLLVHRFGKGAYCGWICSCGGLAETLGDTQRHKMFHGAFWNRVNMLGQALLAVAFVLLAVRIYGWVFPGSWIDQRFDVFVDGKWDGKVVNPFSWKWVVDVFLGGIIGVGLYFKYSGRVWCRFACPLAALMNIYARFSRFRIIADKKKCISCNVCTSVCHQGIDIMNFANKGLPMEDPECVRCSACVQSCPTGVLQFGQVDRKTGAVLKTDRLAASPVLMREKKGI